MVKWAGSWPHSVGSWGNGAEMLRTRAVEVSLWEAVLPKEVRRLVGELARVGALLDDPVFFAPFVPFFDPRVGRPSTPMEVYLRMMFLKFRYRLGYDSLCREVTDSITWRRFCRIPLDGHVPHPTTLMKLTTRCGTAAVDGCNEALLAKAAEARLLRTARLRADTTVVPADVAYPTDSGLLAKAVRRIGVAGRRIQAAGGAVRTRLRDRGRAAGTKARAIGAKLRRRAAQTRDQAQAAVRRITGELAGLAERTATEAEKLLGNARRALRVAQARAAALAAAGGADPAARRRPGRPPPAGHHLTRLLTVTADRGYGDAAVENDLHELGVRTVVIPRKGKPGKARQAREHRPAFRRTVKWRTGSEARISTLKREYGWDRTRLDDLEGARIYTGQAVLAHNLVKIGALVT